MDRLLNPFAPGAGLQPKELAGRDDILEQAGIDMDRLVAGRPVRGLIMLGLRGVGKTVLLVRLREMAEQRKILTAKLESPDDGALPRLLAPELRKILHKLDLKSSASAKMRAAVSALRNFVGAFNVKIGDIEFGFPANPGVADTGDLTQDLTDLLVAIAEAAAERKSAVGIFIDEIQYLSRNELAAIVVACHEISQRGLPLLFVGAGLPQIASLAGTAKSYAERLFDYKTIGPLDEKSARAALTKPAQSAGAKFEKAAVDEILKVTACYPYFIQEWGAHVWDTAKKSPITLADVKSLAGAMRKHLDESFFRVRFDRLTETQQRYLRAMAELGPGPHGSGDIADVLGVKTSAVGPVRQQLIDKGMIWSPRHGETAFTVPMFDSFMRRQMPKLEKHKPRKRKARERKT